MLQYHDKLSQKKAQNLNEILAAHSDLALCYAMKKELIRLFQITDANEARERWTKWFDAADHSGVPALVKFGHQKLKRLDGLVAHAKFHINTGRLEGFNNKIKVAKRIAYGFRNLDFFSPISALFRFLIVFVHTNIKNHIINNFICGILYSPT